MAKTARELLIRNREEAQKLAQKVGVDRLRTILEKSERDLSQRLKQAGSKKSGTFTYEQSKVALAQVRATLKDVKAGITDVLVDGAKPIAEKATEGTVEYLGRVDRQFRGIVQPMALDEAAVYERAINGAQTSVLMRLASSGEPVVGADGIAHPAKEGILDRYGTNTIKYFEEIFQRGVLTKKSFADIRSEITMASPFLQKTQAERQDILDERTRAWHEEVRDNDIEWRRQVAELGPDAVRPPRPLKPKFAGLDPGMWSERIVRTEIAGMQNRAGWESIREADDQLGDMVKIVSCVLDMRTGSDSISLHSQIRLPEQAFDTWYGLMQYPPDRPNDRADVVPHRIAWPIPASLEPYPEALVLQRWKVEKRRGTPPKRAQRSTIPLEKFGNG